MTKKLMSILLVLALSMPLFSFSYNKDLDIAGDITSALSLATPAVLFIDAPSSDYLTIASSWGATMLTSYGMRTLLKHTIDR
ncbi:MAG: hypothetical protein GXY63_08470, partial [Spirochaetales bacterium]|nr:hypothetical protein [Spirochaetales bacterium]